MDKKEIVKYIIENYNPKSANDITDALKDLLGDTLQGMLNAEFDEHSFSFSILDNDNNIYLVKGDSPLSIIDFPEEKIYVYASTDEILYKALIDTMLMNCYITVFRWRK
ncbi:MAG: hypothetical protein E7411_06890 [Ruminococcaceae bacterium]|nr:hypothetical protein [Oscillospiraceae bacterium]